MLWFLLWLFLPELLHQCRVAWRESACGSAPVYRGLFGSGLRVICIVCSGLSYPPSPRVKGQPIGGHLDQLLVPVAVWTCTEPRWKVESVFPWKHPYLPLGCIQLSNIILNQSMENFLAYLSYCLSLDLSRFNFGNLGFWFPWSLVLLAIAAALFTYIALLLVWTLIKFVI